MILEHPDSWDRKKKISINVDRALETGTDSIVRFGSNSSDRILTPWTHSYVKVSIKIKRIGWLLVTNLHRPTRHPRMLKDSLWLFTSIGGLFFILALFFRRLFCTSVLDNIPGPPSSNSIVGRLCSVFSSIPEFLQKALGHLIQLADPNGWEFYRKLSEDYAPGIVKLRGLLGVSHYYTTQPRLSIKASNSLLGNLQARELYVYDPLALHHILVKSPDIYEKTPIVLSYAFIFF